MHPALELMLARMESNPEEFMNTKDRWGDIMRDLSNFATEEERRMLFEKHRAIRLDAVHKQIMRELCAPEQGELDYVPRPSSIITSKKMLNDAKDLFEAQMKREL